MDPTSVSEAIIIGIVSGVAANAVLSVISAYFQRVIIPEYRRLLYRGIVIDGDWEVIGPTTQCALLKVNQSADTLKGNCHFLVFKDRRSELFEEYRSAQVTGFVRDRFVELSFRHEDPTRIGAGVFLLEVTGDGRRMKGWQTFYSVASERITSVPVVLQRFGPRAETGNNFFEDEKEEGEPGLKDADGVRALEE